MNEQVGEKLTAECVLVPGNDGIALGYSITHRWKRAEITRRTLKTCAGFRIFRDRKTVQIRFYYKGSPIYKGG